MVEKAQPGGIRTSGINREWGTVAGQLTNGFVVPAGTPTIAALESTVDETVFDEFDESSTGDSLTVTIQPGEAFVNGWVATDETNDVSLAENTANQSVYLGWDHQAVEADDVIIGRESAFNKASSERLPKIELWQFDTDASGVTNVDDMRRVGPHLDADNAPTQNEFDDHADRHEAGGADAISVTSGMIAANEVRSTELDRAEMATVEPDAYAAAELDDGESHEVPRRVENGETLKVYRWGAYNADTSDAPTGLDVELLDDDDTVQASSNTANEQDGENPVASHENTSGTVSTFVLRVKNDTGEPIGDGDAERGVGMHFGYVVE